MNPETDYYACLGVLPSAEDIIIRAAYRALAQRYHPDRNNGSADAKARMQQINEAYEILSDPGKRRAYDDLRKQRKDYSEYSADDEHQESALDQATAKRDEHWKIATEYYPDLRQLNEELRKTSYRLAFAFKTLLLETKQFERRQHIANELQDAFLNTYFGSNPEVIAFAKQLIDGKAREALRELNRVVGVLGSDSDPERIISRILEKNPVLIVRNQEIALEWARRIVEGHWGVSGDSFIEMLQGTVERQVQKKSWLLGDTEHIRVSLWGKKREFKNQNAFYDWVRYSIAPEVIRRLADSH
jgi:curved DNA-binding protein CbpA